MTTKLKFIIALIVSLTLGLAPFTPEPHLFGKIRWIMGGGEGMEITDYWDLILHGAPWLFLFYFGFQLLTGGNKTSALIKEALDKKDTVIIDVREPNEYANGHAENAINMPLSSFGTFIPEIKKMEGTKLLYCRSGMRSANATNQLKKAGVENVINVGTAGAIK